MSRLRVVDLLGQRLDDPVDLRLHQADDIGVDVVDAGQVDDGVLAL